MTEPDAPLDERSAAPVRGAEVRAEVRVEVRGPGHHDRAERALPVLRALAAAGLRSSVETDLRPRLADDVRALLEAGARQVEMRADGVRGAFRLAGEPAAAGLAGADAAGAGRAGEGRASTARATPPLGSEPSDDVVIALIADSVAATSVVGEGERADHVRGLLTDL